MWPIPASLTFCRVSDKREDVRSVAAENQVPSARNRSPSNSNGKELLNKWLS